MKISKIGGKGNVLELEISGVSPAWINTIRRLIINEVPVLAVEVCEIRKNNSIMYDEMLAHRLGLVPLSTDLESYSLPNEDEKKSGDYQARSSVKGTIVAKGPCIVLSGEMKFKDPKVKPIQTDMPIVQLLEGQEIEVEMTAVLGQGKDHVKWSPGIAYFNEIPKGAPVVDERGAIKQGVELEHNGKTGHYYMRIEGWGQMKPQDILSAAADRFSVMLKEFDSVAKEL